MKISILIIFFLILSFLQSPGQVAHNKSFQKVLGRNTAGKPYSFNLTAKDKFNQELILTYLGAVKTNRKQVFKIITYAFIWGPNFYTSGSIYIFNAKNQFVGVYHLGGESDLPIKLIRNNLLFTNDRYDNCNKNIKTLISLRTGLPQNMFIKCKDKFGDLYSFSAE